MVFELKSRRKIFYEIYGDPQGIPCYFYHGFPGSHVQAKVAHEQAKVHGIQIITADRPGLGNSDFDPHRTLQSTIHDIAELADFLGHQKFYMIGVSGGAPYALASAHYLKDRILALGLVCPLGPLGEKEFRKSFSRAGRTFFSLVETCPWIIKKIYKRLILKFDTNPDRYLDRLTRGLSVRDREATRNPEVKMILRSSFQHSYKQNPENAMVDMEIYVSKWDFKLSDIQVPTYMWHGTDDHIVPYQNSVLIQQSIPHAEFFTFQGEGHYSVAIEKLPLIMQKLKAIHQ